MDKMAKNLTENSEQAQDEFSLRKFRQITKVNLSDDEIDELITCDLPSVQHLMELFVVVVTESTMFLEDSESHMAELRERRQELKQIFDIAGRSLGYEVDEFNSFIDNLAENINQRVNG